MKFSEKLTELRHSRGWSQEQLGERLGVTRQTVSKWELGSTTPELEKLAMMSDIFGVSTDELIKGEPQEASRPSEPSEPAEAIQDTKPLRSRLHFEYKSRRTVRGLPLVHINFGAGRYTAKGIFALGNKAVGVVAGGFLSVGVVSFGLISAGLLALGTFSVGVLAFGALAAGLSRSEGRLRAGLLSAAQHAECTRSGERLMLLISRAGDIPPALMWLSEMLCGALLK